MHRTIQKRVQTLIITLFVSFVLSGCGDDSLAPEEVAEQFWDAAQQGKLETAKQYVYWETANYLKYFKAEKFNIKRVEFAEANVQESFVKIDTTLILEKKNKGNSDIRIPTQTVLIKTEGVWRVQLKQTLAAVINKTINAAANQFNQMLQEGMLELNKALSGSINEISKSLEEGAKELGDTLEDNAKHFGETFDKFQQELEKSIPKSKDAQQPSRKEI
jgi:hypothetical protein